MLSETFTRGCCVVHQTQSHVNNERPMFTLLSPPKEVIFHRRLFFLTDAQTERTTIPTNSDLSRKTIRFWLVDEQVGFIFNVHQNTAMQYPLRGYAP